ncbi:uncharacterized Nudix hydrolase NudL-like isoform X1 [Mercenaria mercenaria]|uniref:uncharacterized Nudix hydrolase NudL-like isoform X1 n=1 Tax=Mercenaria mercenaria TaxID=6596 RepID=UPI00234E49A9|nr:uncharacterized Nudix hydrolase NudL-like isoform X1 [Mercenaria mercenaria]
MAESLIEPTPNNRQLKELFRPFDTRFNKEKFHLNIPDGLSFRKASVLIPLFYKDGEIHVLLTVRTKHMPSHAGHVAFPGGMVDPGDADAIATALREAEEEVGIRPKDVDIVAVLSPNIVRPNSLVTPVVGIVSSDFKLHINPREVDMVFDLPLSRFLSLDGRTQENFKFDENLFFSVYHFRDTVNGRELDTWGFSALLCIQAAMVAFQSDLKICFHKDLIVTKENCFTPESTQEIIESWNAKSKL